MATEPPTRKQWSDKDLLALPDDGHKYEVLGQQLYMSPTGFEQEDIATEIAMRLRAFVKENGLGVVVGSSMGCRMRSGDVLSPDVAFISRDRLIGLERPQKGFFDGAPDLVVEVLSPHDPLDKIHRKLPFYFENGTRLAWVVNPDEEAAYDFRGPSTAEEIRPTAQLNGGNVVPGFTLYVSELFHGLDFGKSSESP